MAPTTTEPATRPTTLPTPQTEPSPATQTATTRLTSGEATTRAAAVVGKPIDRVDGRLKVTGKAAYAADFPVQNVAHAVAVQSVIASGKVKSIDETEAMRQQGVRAVVTRKNAGTLYTVSREHQPGTPGQTYLPMQDDEIHYAGQIIAIVVADTLAQAMYAAHSVKVDYEQTRHVVEISAAVGAAFDPRKMGRGDPPDSTRGDADRAIQESDVRIEQTYTTPVENHNPMEMSATTAVWNGDRLTLYDSTQWIYGVRSVVSTWLGVPGDRVRVIDPFVGGAFGCKGSMWPHEVLAAVAARVSQRPVKLMLTRPQMFTCVGYRPATIQKVAIGANKAGQLAGIVHQGVSQTSMWREQWVEAFTKQTRMLYACPNVRTAQQLVPVNANAPTQMRAPGHATGTFALEVAMDELAVELGMDPVELRRKNYAERDDDEKRPFSSKALRECYAQGAERFGWAHRSAKPRSMSDGKTLIGWGMATATYPTNRQEASARVRVLPDGRAIVSTASHDLGTGTYTILTQIAAETLGLPVEKVKVELGDSMLPEAAVSGGSQTAATVGSAVRAACLKAVAGIKERAIADHESPLTQRSAGELAVANGRIFLKDNASVGETIVRLLERNGSRPVEATVDLAPPNMVPTDDAGSTRPKDEYSKHAWGAQFAEVRVDPLGEIRVTRFVGAFAGGRILNPKTARSQIMGGIVWGIGMALHERTIYDTVRGKIVNDNLADYLIPVNADVPAIDAFFVSEEDSHVNPIGVKGVGELGVTGAAAAVANAVYHATGIRLRDLPLSIEHLL